MSEVPSGSRTDLVRLLTDRGVPSVTVIEWWPPSRRRPWFHRPVGRAWVVDDAVPGRNGAWEPGTALGSDGHFHGFLPKEHLTRRRGLLMRRLRSPRQVPTTRLYPAGAVQYVPTARWERPVDVDEFCRRHGLVTDR